MKDKTLAMNVKKVIRWEKGLAVFVTKEAKIFKWDDKTFITVSAVRDEEGEKIIIKKAIIK